ncbi:MAG: FAD-binding protein [Actinobacteria bacterium]|nr:FAD-binding protein [Actinomycetota bacterium]
MDGDRFVDELCNALGVDATNLARTINGFVSTDDVTGTAQQLTFPLYAAWVTSGILTTQGGLDIDLEGQVRHRDGGTIAGLYAGGGTAVGISGPDSRGYSSGNGLLSACGLGWIIGENLARR